MTILDFTTEVKFTPRVLHVIQCSAAVTGIAQLGPELFVCTWGSERAAVYDVTTYSETRHVTVRRYDL